MPIIIGPRGIVWANIVIAWEEVVKVYCGETKQCFKIMKFGLIKVGERTLTFWKLVFQLRDVVFQVSGFTTQVAISLRGSTPINSWPWWSMLCSGYMGREIPLLPPVNYESYS